MPSPSRCMLLQMLHQAESRKRRDPWSNRPRSRDMGSRKIPAEQVSGHRGLGTRAAGFDGVPIRLRCDARRASRGPACSQRWRSAPKIVGSRGGALARALAVRQAPACPACCPPSKPLARLGPIAPRETLRHCLAPATNIVASCTVHLHTRQDRQLPARNTNACCERQTRHFWAVQYDIMFFARIAERTGLTS